MTARAAVAAAIAQSLNLDYVIKCSDPSPHYPNPATMLMLDSCLLHIRPTGYVKLETWDNTHTFEHVEDAVRFAWLYEELMTQDQ